MTFNSVYDQYINYLELRLKPTTIHGIKYKFNNHILPYIGNYDIYLFNLENYVSWWNKLKKLNYSYTFYNQIYSYVKSFFNYLNFNYNITNYALIVGKISANKSQNKVLNVWSIEEYNRFIKKVDDQIYHALFNTLFFTGIRKGELLALKWEDFYGDSININKTITKELFNGKKLELNTKTKKSTRIIPIDRKLKIELKNLHRYYNKNYSNFNSKFYIFGGPIPIAPTTLERKKNNYCDKADVKRIRIHDFRHSHATMLYNKNVDIKLIQERLGHEDISTTLNIYVHTTEEQQKRLINTINLLRL